MASEREHFKVDSTALEEGDVGQLVGGMSGGAIGILPPTNLLTYWSVTRHKLLSPDPSTTPKLVICAWSLGRFRRRYWELRKPPMPMWANNGIRTNGQDIVRVCSKCVWTGLLDLVPRASALVPSWLSDSVLQRGRAPKCSQDIFASLLTAMFLFPLNSVWSLQIAQRWCWGNSTLLVLFLLWAV